MNTENYLQQKYTLEEGKIYVTGVQALVRIPLDQQRLDRRAQLNTAGFISGYQGSPLGAYDLHLNAAKDILARHDIIHIPGVNEEIAVTSIFGTQIAHIFPGQKFDGIVGYWYGKGPGLDRSMDALKHAAFIGTKPTGGALLFAGDDPNAKSSTIPYGSEFSLCAVGTPILYPGNVQEVLDFGLHGVAMSRFCGSWVALKMVNNVCDGGGTAEVAPDRIAPMMPDYERPPSPVSPSEAHMLWPKTTIPLEGHVFHHRLVAACHYARANHLNDIVLNPGTARLGIVAAGATYRDLRQALQEMELSETDLRQRGVRLLRLGMIYPIDRTIIEEFARGLDDIVVIEEKRSFIESMIRDVLYEWPQRPRIVGKFDQNREPLFPIGGAVSVDHITKALAPRLLELGESAGVHNRLDELHAMTTGQMSQGPMRLMNFCSGCPHNRSTRLLEGQLAGGGIGCHTLCVVTGQKERSIEYITQMGGEGAVWIGAGPFVEHEHMFQNLGDGTYTHSGRLAVQAAVAAGAHMTFKILYNHGVAMTGGQEPAGNLSVSELTHELQSMGVSKIIVVAEDLTHHRGQGNRLAPGVVLMSRDDMPSALRDSEAAPGVSALIFDQPCAAERRRRRRRGLEQTPSRWLLINPEVCEGCGDCGVKSNCMSVIPIQTEFGPKTAIHVSSCNQDYSCLDGDCPAFIEVQTEPGTGMPRPESAFLEIDEPPEPNEKVALKDGYTILMTGIGGTGVLTVNAVLAATATLDGKHCVTLDQIGAAQKGGAVVSSITLSERPIEGSQSVSDGRADLLLGLDIIGATQPANLAKAHRSRTAAVINTSGVATADMVRDKNIEMPPEEQLVERIKGVTDPDRSVYIDAGQLAERLFNNHMMANIFCIGVAYQAGLIPLRAANIEQAIRLNGVAVKPNIAAFRWGRRAVADPEAMGSLRSNPATEAHNAHRRALVDLEAAGPRVAADFERVMSRFEGSDEVRRLVEIRVANLILYQDAEYAGEYVKFVDEVRRSETETIPDGAAQVTDAVARSLYKLMAYKDEYEVARLHLRTEATDRIMGSFENVRRYSFMLQPPFLRALGLHRKIAFGPASRILLRLLAALRRLRGTAFDPFGRTSMRRIERALPSWYRDLIREAMTYLDPHTHSAVAEIAKIPDRIRGYEEIKLRSIERAKETASRLLGELTSQRKQRLAG